MRHSEFIYMLKFILPLLSVNHKLIATSFQILQEVSMQTRIILIQIINQNFTAKSSSFFRFQQFNND